MAFKDHFSSQSAAYSRYRPSYPPALIRYVASLARDRRVAVDCATGNGQAAVALAEHFETVLAIDGSQSQLARAQSSERVRYAAGLAEQLPVPESSVGLVAAAQAAHWFDLDRFHAECRRVLVPGGVVAIWTYEKFRVDPGVDAVIDQFYSGVVGPYWPPERRFVDEGYRTLPFPWREESAPPFALETDWDLQLVLGYLATWSAVQRYKDLHSEDPLSALAPRLATVWPDGERRRLRWPVHLRVGRA
jgi:SAM-dependent methyltransferase